jgi:hypothetical protein
MVLPGEIFKRLGPFDLISQEGVQISTDLTKTSEKAAENGFS